MTETDTTRLYRVENPTKTAEPDGIVSHEALVGQWFTPNLATASNYIRKATQTFGKDAGVIDGARLVITDVPTSDLNGLHVSHHPIAAEMDVEDDNYIIAPETYPRVEIDLDEALGELRGNLGRFDQLQEARRRLGKIARGLSQEQLHK